MLPLNGGYYFPIATNSGGGSGGADDEARAAISAHIGNTEVHVSVDEKAAWSAKANLSDIPTSLPANGGNADSIIDYNNPETSIEIGWAGAGLSSASHIAAYDTSEIDSVNVVKIKDLSISSLAELLVAAKHNCFVINLNNMGAENVVNDFKYPNNYEGNYYSDSDDQSGLPEGWWYIKYFNHMYETGYGFQIAYSMDSLSELPRYRTSDTNGWKNWRMISDGGNAASVGAYTEEKIAALEARIAALEGGAET